jgi:hypothetical protein
MGINQRKICNGGEMSILSDGLPNIDKAMSWQLFLIFLKLSLIAFFFYFLSLF